MNMKKVAGPKAPKRQPPSPTPPATRSQMLGMVWRFESKKREGQLQAFRDKMGLQENGQLGSVASTIEWSGYDAMCAEAYLAEMRFAAKFIEPLPEEDDLALLAKVQEVLEQREEAIITDLTGGTGLGSGGTGPWHHSSTNPFANIWNDARCTAKRDVLVTIRTMMQLLRGE